MALMMDEEELPSSNGTNEPRTSSFSEPDSLIVIVPLSVIYGIIFVMGIFGNISTCIVIGPNRSMHTTTNFYFSNIAISHLLLLICGLPLQVYRLWNPFSYPLGEIFCITSRLISETSFNSTILTIIAFTVERFLAVCFPFQPHQLSKFSRIVRYIIGIWIFALCAAIPQVIPFGILTAEENGQIDSCAVTKHGVHQFLFISSFGFFVISMFSITVLYVLIFVKLHKSRVLHPVNESSVESGERSNGTSRFKSGASQRRVIRMLVAVALSFFLCWAPFQVQRLIAIYGKKILRPTDTLNKVYVVLTSLSRVLYYLSTSIHPILYITMSEKFRNAFKVTLSSWCSRPDRSQLERTYRARELPSSPHPLLQRRILTDSSQLFEVPPRAQCLNRSNLSVVNEESKLRLHSLFWQRLAEQTDSLTLSQSISNSSLREIDQELNNQELANYLYDVNCKILGKFCDTSV